MKNIKILPPPELPIELLTKWHEKSRCYKTPINYWCVDHTGDAWGVCSDVDLRRKYREHRTPFKIGYSIEQFERDIKYSVGVTYLPNIEVEDGVMNKKEISLRGLGIIITELEPIPKSIEINEPVKGRLLSEFELGDKVRFRHPNKAYNTSDLVTVIDYQGKPAILRTNNKAESNSYHEPYWYLDSDIVNDCPRVNTTLKPNPDRDSRVVKVGTLKLGDLFKWDNQIWWVKINSQTDQRFYCALSNEYLPERVRLNDYYTLVELIGHIEFSDE